MKRLIAIAIVTLVIVSASMTTNTYAFTDKQEAAIERQCRSAEAAEKQERKRQNRKKSSSKNNNNIEDDSFFMEFFNIIIGR